MSIDDIEEYLVKYKPYVIFIVKKFKVSKFDEDDLIQAGLIGMLQAINAFDENYNVKLTTFSFKYVYGEVYKEYQKLHCYGSSYLNRVRMFIKKHPEYTTEAIIKELKISKETLFLAVNNIDKVSYLTDEQMETIKEQKKVEYNIDKQLTKDEKIIWNLVLKRYSQKDIAAILNLSQPTVSRKITKIINKLKNN